jgi:hypothetical protein
MMLELGGDHDPQRSSERGAHLFKPGAVLLGPQRCAAGESDAMRTKNRCDAKLRALGLLLVAPAQTEQLSQLHLFRRWHVNRCEVTTAIKQSQVHCIDAIRLAAVSRLLRNQRWRNHLAVESIFTKHTVQHKAGARCLITGSHRSFGRESAEQLAYLHQIAGKPDNLGLHGAATQNGCGDRILVNIEADPDRLGHGWTLLGKLSVLMHHSCGSGQLALTNPR